MTDSEHRSHSLERARMHDQLAASTNDTAARQIHQAMAAEYRRRAGEVGSADLIQQPKSGPMLEIYQTVD